MKNGKNTMIFTMAIVCFVFCMAMFMQFKVVEETDIQNLETMRETELREQLATWKEKYEDINTQYEDTIAKRNEYIDKRESNQEASVVLDKELEQAKILSGQTNVKGQGVIVTLSDNEDNIAGTVTSTHLLTLVNELRLAGAEAISINDQRVVNMTDIFAMEYIILVNNDLNGRITDPYVVKAIGNQKHLESALVTKKVGYVDQYSEINVNVETHNNITIEKYKGTINLKYLKIKEI